VSILRSRWAVALLAAVAVSPQVRRLLRRGAAGGMAGVVAAGKGAYGAVRWVTGGEAPAAHEEKPPTAEPRERASAAAK
jgi:hypothetical protein